MADFNIRATAQDQKWSSTNSFLLLLSVLSFEDTLDYPRCDKHTIQLPTKSMEKAAAG